MSAPPPPKPSELLAELECPQLVDDCLERVRIRVKWGEITSHFGQEVITQEMADVYLDTEEVRVRIPLGERPVFKFSANYYRSFDRGDVDMELFFILKERTATEVVYEVHDSEPQESPSGIMALSSRRLYSRQERRLFG